MKGAMDCQCDRPSAGEGEGGRGKGEGPAWPAAVMGRRWERLTSRSELVTDGLFCELGLPCWGVCARPVMGFLFVVQALCCCGGCLPSTYVSQFPRRVSRRRPQAQARNARHAARGRHE